jgi:hypothetical protein
LFLLNIKVVVRQQASRGDEKEGESFPQEQPSWL